ncbi:unnamed protein product [Cutaneotrichosporon oleaginosum]
MAIAKATVSDMLRRRLSDGIFETPPPRRAPCQAPALSDGQGGALRRRARGDGSRWSLVVGVIAVRVSAPFPPALSDASALRGPLRGMLDSTPELLPARIAGSDLCCKLRG